jgi:hypothetical protein
MSTKTTPPSIRLTIPVSPEVHAVFQRMANASGRPAGRLMGEWLHDHRGAAEQICDVLEGLRASSGRAASLGALASAYADQAQSVIDSAKSGSGVARHGESEAAGRATPRTVSARTVAKKGLTPPVGNTGGKVSGAKAPKSSK